MSVNLAKVVEFQRAAEEARRVTAAPATAHQRQLAKAELQFALAAGRARLSMWSEERPGHIPRADILREKGGRETITVYSSAAAQWHLHQLHRQGVRHTWKREDRAGRQAYVITITGVRKP